MKTWVALAAVLSVTPVPSRAQPPPSPRSAFTRELSVSVGLGHVFVYEGDTLGNKPNIGGSLALVHRSGWGVDFEMNRTPGFSPELARCAIEGTFCYGTTHEGIRPPLIASLGVQYRFKGRRVQPYLTGGLGIMRFKSVQSTGLTGGPDVIHSEAEVRDTGLGPDLGAGLRLSPSRSISFSPEIRWLDAPWLSGANLAVTRLVLRTAYSW